MFFLFQFGSTGVLSKECYASVQVPSVPDRFDFVKNQLQGEIDKLTSKGHQFKKTLMKREALSYTDKSN